MEVEFGKAESGNAAVGSAHAEDQKTVEKSSEK